MIESGLCRRAENTERTGQSGGGGVWTPSAGGGPCLAIMLRRGRARWTGGIGREEGDAAACQRGGKVCVEMRDETGACQAGG